VNYCQLSASRGHAPAQLWFGERLATGDGVSIDKVAAVRWFRQAADQCEPEGQFRLGIALRDGIGAERDREAALELFLSAGAQGHHQAAAAAVELRTQLEAEVTALSTGDLQAHADAGLPRAQCELGRRLLHSHSKGATALLRVAADHGSREAMVILATKKAPDVPRSAQTGYAMIAAGLGEPAALVLAADLLTEGKQVGSDSERALRFYSLAAAQGDAEALAKFRAATHRARTKQLPIQAVLKRADAGDSDAQYEAGRRYATGAGVKQDDAKAARYFGMAVTQNHPRAFAAYAHCFANGIGVAQNIGSAVHFFRCGAAHIDRRSLFGLGNLLLQEEAVPFCDFHEVLRCFRMAANLGHRGATEALAAVTERCEREFALEEGTRVARRKADDGDVDAMVEFGGLCWRGKGMVVDAELAIEYWGLAAEAGSTEAMARLGALWARSDTFGKDLEEAVRWFRIGSDAGNRQCQWEMGRALELGLGVKEDRLTALSYYRMAGDGPFDPSIPAMSLARRDYIRLLDAIKKEG
jgi:TPR repeat protein